MEHTPSEQELVLRCLVVGPLMENVYIVGSQAAGECMVVDPGAEQDRILHEIDQLGLTVKLIVNTHGHSDHIGAVAGVKAATNAPFAIHRADVPFLKGSASWASQVIQGYGPPPTPDRLLSEGDILEIAGLSFRVLETPGHTPGGISLYGHGLVFTGDTLFQAGIGRYDLEGSDGRQLFASIFSKLLTLPDETVVLPGHGQQSTIGEEKRSNPFLRGMGLPLG